MVDTHPASMLDLLGRFMAAPVEEIFRCLQPHGPRLIGVIAERFDGLKTVIGFRSKERLHVLLRRLDHSVDASIP